MSQMKNALCSGHHIRTVDAQGLHTLQTHNLQAPVFLLYKPAPSAGERPEKHLIT